jgi:D-alanine-D-alanine ligase
MIKPLSYGSSIGVAFADSIESLVAGIEEAFRYAPVIMIEEYIRGKEATCGIVEAYRGKAHYPLFPIAVHPGRGKSFCDYTDRYTGGITQQCPGSFSWKEKEELQQLATRIHCELGLRHYSSSDFIVTSRGIYFLEVDALPTLSEHSALPLALREGGCELPVFLDHLLTLALKRN